MKTVCAWCNKIIRATDCNHSDNKVTHGICPGCKSNASREILLLKVSLLRRKIDRQA